MLIITELTLQKADYLTCAAAISLMISDRLNLFNHGANLAGHNSAVFHITFNHGQPEASNPNFSISSKAPVFSISSFSW